MKKKVLSFVLLLTLFLSLPFSLTACMTKMYKLKFIVDDNVYFEIEIAGSQEIEFPENPEKNGYVFEGWYFDRYSWQDELNENTFVNNTIERHEVVFAKWSEIFDVAFVGEDNLPLVNEQRQQIQNVSRKDGDVLGEYQVPYKEGYNFVGWKLNGETFDVETPITSDITLVAVFEVKVIEITFLYDGGEYLFEVAYGDSFLIPSSISVPTKVGYNGEWDRKVFQNLTEDIEVRPVYTPKEFYINLNYGSVYTGEITVLSKMVTFDGEVGELPEVIEQEGYNFAGWTYNGVVITDETIWQIDNPPGQITANWEVKTFTVTYKKDATSELIAEVVYGYDGEVKQGQVPKVPVLEGHSGVWARTNFEGILEDLEVYVTYTPNTYKASVNANGGSVSVYNLDITYGEQFFDNLPTPTWTNYDFLGWYINNVKVEETDVWTFANNETTIVAKWQVTDTGCIITSSNVFEIDGIEYSFDVKATSITLIGKLKRSTTSFSLNGKFNVSEGATWVAYDTYTQSFKQLLANNTIYRSNNKVTEYIEVTNSEGTESRLYTVTMEWNKEFDVEFYSKGKKISTSKIEEGETLKISEFPSVESDEGYSFIGWESEFNDGIVEDDYVVVTNIKFYAVFECDDESISQGLSYNVGTKGAYITGIGTCIDKDVVIPKFIDGKHYVVGISTRAFADSDMTSVFIPNSVEEIGYYAFQNLESLTSVTFEQNSKLKILYYNAFDNVAISTLIIPNSIEQIYESTESVSFVSNCENLTTLKIEDGNGKYITPANSNCVILNTSDKKLIAGCKTTIIPNDIKIIGGEAFAGSSLKSIVVPKSVEIIQIGAFENCEEFESITFESGSNLSKVENLAFSGCSLLKSITLPNSLQSISSRAFVGCDSLESILNFHTDNLYAITGEMFSTLTSLKTLTTREGSSTIEYCPTSNAIISKEGVLIAGFDKTVIPEGVTELGIKAFYSNPNIKTITIPKSITAIGEYAFAMCKNLESVIFESGSELKEIKHDAFLDCEKLNNLIIPNSVETIGAYAFCDCENLSNFTISSSVTSIGEWAFYKTAFRTIEIPAGVTVLENNLFYNSKIEEVRFAENSNLIKIDRTVFSYSKLKVIELPSSLTQIGIEAFSKCELTEIIIPLSVTTIGQNAFGYYTMDGLNIYCYAESKPNDWNSSWYMSNLSSQYYGSVTVYWYRETEPTEEGNYWHYGTENEVLVWGAEA